jgi:threonine synthase
MNSLERYQDFLPLSQIHPNLLLGEGDTPFLRLETLMEEFDLPDTFAKNEIFNPTASFKDRGTVTAVHAAKASGIERIGTVSTGNMGISTAAYGARAGMKTFVFIKKDTSIEKLFSAGVHGPILLRIDGDYGKLWHESFRIGKDHGIYFMNSTDAFRIEGYKVIGFEIFSQLSSERPTYIFAPVSSGGHLIGLMKAYRELQQQGLVHHIPTFVGVQAQGCSPIAQAFAAGMLKYERVDKTETVAQSITNPDPPGGNILLKMIREHEGIIMDVTDEEILTAQRIIAEREGIFCLPASATALAGLLKLQKKQKFDPQDRIILVITGSGVKNIKVLDKSRMKIHDASLSELSKTMASLTE